MFVCCVNHTGSLYVFDIKYPMDDLVPSPNKLIIVKKPNQTIEGSQQVCLSDGRLPDVTPRLCHAQRNQSNSQQSQGS